MKSNEPTESIEVAETTIKYDTQVNQGRLVAFWMDCVSLVDKQGLPTLVAFFMALIVMPISKLKIFNEFWQAYFLEESTPSWYILPTFVFLVVLSLGFILKIKSRTSLRSLKKHSHAFRILEKEGVIDETTAARAMTCLMANYLVNVIGSTPEQLEKAKELINNDFYRDLFSKIKES